MHTPMCVCPHFVFLHVLACEEGKDGVGPPGSQEGRRWLSCGRETLEAAECHGGHRFDSPSVTHWLSHHEPGAYLCVLTSLPIKWDDGSSHDTTFGVGRVTGSLHTKHPAQDLPRSAVLELSRRAGKDSRGFGGHTCGRSPTDAASEWPAPSQPGRTGPARRRRSSKRLSRVRRSPSSIVIHH